MTNPAIDPLREAVVVRCIRGWGRGRTCWIKMRRWRGCRWASPYLSLAQVAALRAGRASACLRGACGSRSWLACLRRSMTLEAALDVICRRSIELVRNGARDFAFDGPMAWRGSRQQDCRSRWRWRRARCIRRWCAAGLRTLVGMAVEAGDCRDIHHAAILIGYGAGAVCPWLALETARAARLAAKTRRRLRRRC